MKFPKNRANVFAVVREQVTGSSVLGVFPDFEEANDFRYACEQEWLEKIGELRGYVFSTQLSTFYG